MGKVDIWMPIYIGDYLKDTYHLKAEEHGIYLLLMFYYWNTGSLPTEEDDLIEIARITKKKVHKLHKVLNTFFAYDGRLYSHKRIDRERTKSFSNRRKAQENGKLGGRPKGGKKPNNNLSVIEKKPIANPDESSSSSSSSSPIYKEEKKNPPIPPSKGGKSFKPDYSFIQNSGWKSLYTSWCLNKKSPYTKQVGVVAGFTKLQRLSENNLETAQAIVDQSFAGNWAGLVSLKEDKDEAKYDTYEETMKQVKEMRRKRDQRKGIEGNFNKTSEAKTQ